MTHSYASGKGEGEECYAVRLALGPNVCDGCFDMIPLRSLYRALCSGEKLCEDCWHDGEGIKAWVR